MTISDFKDNIMILKDSARSWILHAPMNNKSLLVESIVEHLKLSGITRVITKPGAILIISDDRVIRLPLDKSSNARCRFNKIMLEKLNKSSVASYIPRFICEGSICGQQYYCEERLTGVAIDIPISKMDYLVAQASDFITTFHKETATDIQIDNSNFNRLFAREFKRLEPYLNDEYRHKAERIEKDMKSQIIGRQFKTVWMHGDYNIENMLFDTGSWQLKGVIDWDLALMKGLPLIDTLYLIIYKDSLFTRNTIVDVFKNKLINMNLNYHESEIIKKYMRSLDISSYFLRPLFVMFWINHVGKRYRDKRFDNMYARNKWIDENICRVIDIMQVAT